MSNYMHYVRTVFVSDSHGPGVDFRHLGEAQSCGHPLAYGILGIPVSCRHICVGRHPDIEESRLAIDADFDGQATNGWLDELIDKVEGSHGADAYLEGQSYKNQRCVGGVTGRVKDAESQRRVSALGVQVCDLGEHTCT